MKFAARSGRNPLADEITVRSSATPRVNSSAQPLLPAEVSASGRALEPETRAYFEHRFGHDFSRVRVHADSAAASSASAAGAMAYTVGSDIVFGAGLYSPKSESGRTLLAHELAHVVQQQRPAGGISQSEHEYEAVTAADQAVKGEQGRVRLAARVSMQRQALPAMVPQTDLTESASPTIAAAIGSVTLDGFTTGKADISSTNRTKLEHTVETIIKLLKKYPASKIHVIGYTDAVGQENNNQALGQERADSVQAALMGLGIPEVAMQVESRGAADLLVKTTKADPRNRRVEIRFETSTMFRGAMSQGLTLTPNSGERTPSTFVPGGQGFSGLADVCVQNPTLCYGKGSVDPGGVPKLPPAALQSIPDDTPFQRMDVLGANEPYTSHGRSPQEGGDLRQTWARLYWKYRKVYGLSEELAAKAANSELSATAGKEQSRDNPNALDRGDTEMKRAYPDATTVGPASVTIFKF